VFDATRKDGTISTVTEMCTGQHLDATTPYPEVRVRTIITQLLSALTYMHRRGLFHNNLTTENSKNEWTSAHCSDCDWSDSHAAVLSCVGSTISR
jgi:serine/threonine protein kinase